MHFEQAHDYRRAVRHLRQAAQNHFLRYANREAIAYLSRALQLVDQWPDATGRAEVRIAVLEHEGLARRAMGDMAGSAEAFSALADYAREQGHIEDEVKALIDLATALSWIDRDLCLAAAERFVVLSRGLADQLLQAHALGSWSYWHVLFIGWGDEHSEALAAAIAAARQDGDRAMLGLHLARYCFFECLRSNYRAAHRAGEEASQLALVLIDAHSYLLSQYYQAWALLHMGRWGEMRRILDEGLEMAERNESRRWEVLFRMEQAWLYMQAFDLEPARDICGRALEQARRIQHPYTESLSMILLGMVHLMLEQNEEAFCWLNDVAARLERERGLMDWILRMLMHNALSRYWLCRGELARARREAELVCELAAGPGERTYVALGHRVLAEIAMAGKDWDAAEAAVSRSLAVLEGADAPLAEWRVCMTAAQLYEQLGRSAEAAQNSRRSAEVLRRLAASLAETDPLRQSLLKAPAVQHIQGGAAAD